MRRLVQSDYGEGLYDSDSGVGRAMRQRGEGTVYRLPDGRWRARLVYGGKARSWTRRTATEARAALREALRQDPAELMRLHKLVTFDAWADEWLADMTVQRPRTVSTYRYKLRVPRDVLGTMPLAKIGTADIKRVLQAASSSGMSATSVAHVHSTLHTLFAAARRERRIIANPVEAVSKPPRSHFEAATLTTDQAHKLLAEAAGDETVGALVIVALATGMRMGELLALRWSDVHDGHLSVVRSVRVLDGKPSITPPKTRAGKRVIPLDERVMRALTTQRWIVDRWRLRSGAAWQDNDLIFPTRRGRIRGQGGVHRPYHALLSRAGLPDIRFHDLRHTAGLYVTRATGLVVASRVLGHSNPMITARFYGHAQPSDLLAGVKSLADTLWPDRDGVVTEPTQNPLASGNLRPVEQTRSFQAFDTGT